MENLDDFNGNQLVGVCVAFLILTYTSVLLRCWVRIKITRAFAIDDWFMVASLVLFTLTCTFVLCGVYFGMGKHNAASSPENQVQALKYQALATMAYIANMMFIKLSIAIFLLRISMRRTYTYILYVSIFVVIVWSIVTFFYDIFQCMPVEARWDPSIINSRCVSGTQFVAAAYCISGMSILTDWLYALLPIPMIWSVRMTKQAKVTVVFILSLGICASIATLIRLKYLIDLTTTKDILYSGTQVMVWTLVEPGVAITAASLTTIRPLLRLLNFSGFSSTPATSSSFSNSLASHFRYPRLPSRDQPALRRDISTAPSQPRPVPSAANKGPTRPHKVSTLGRLKGKTIIAVHEEERDIGMMRGPARLAGSSSLECILESPEGTGEGEVSGRPAGNWI